MATSFAQLVTDVYALTNRPDLVNETAIAIRAATLKAHQSDDYIFDLQESGIAFSTSDYFQQLDYKSIFPQWRKPRYLRKYDYTNPPGTPGKFLEYIIPEKVVDEYYADRTDVFYVAGANIQIRSSTQDQYYLAGWYNNPITTPVGYNSWIANDFEFAIVYEAVAIVLKMIGFTEETAMFRLMVAEQLQLLKQHAVTGIGM